MGLLAVSFPSSIGILCENEAVAVGRLGWFLKAGTTRGGCLRSRAELGWGGGGGCWIVGLTFLAELLALGFRREGFLAHLG